MGLRELQVCYLVPAARHAGSHSWLRWVTLYIPIVVYIWSRALAVVVVVAVWCVCVVGSEGERGESPTARKGVSHFDIANDLKPFDNSLIK